MPRVIAEQPLKADLCEPNCDSSVSNRGPGTVRIPKASSKYQPGQEPQLIENIKDPPSSVDTRCQPRLSK